MNNTEMNTENVACSEVMDNRAYLGSLVGELMADTEWQFPPQLRFFLVADLDWTLLGL